MGKHLCDKCCLSTGILYGEDKRSCEIFVVDCTVEDGKVVSCGEFQLDPFRIEEGE
jgi:hypothetical protein